jgi:hypothetical protein
MRWKRKMDPMSRWLRARRRRERQAARRLADSDKLKKNGGTR